jgi:hypothetical protein
LKIIKLRIYKYFYIKNYITVLIPEAALAIGSFFVLPWSISPEYARPFPTPPPRPGPLPWSALPILSAPFDLKHFGSSSFL